MTIYFYRARFSALRPTSDLEDQVSVFLYHCYRMAQLFLRALGSLSVASVTRRARVEAFKPAFTLIQLNHLDKNTSVWSVNIFGSYVMYGIIVCHMIQCRPCNRTVQKMDAAANYYTLERILQDWINLKIILGQISRIILFQHVLKICFPKGI